MDNLKALSIAELLRLHVGINEELRYRKVMRGENNPTGDLAEFLFCCCYSWEQAGNSEKAFDAKDDQGNRYQIKGRRLNKYNPSRQLSAIRSLDGFETLAAVLFDHEYRVSRAALIPKEVICNHSTHVKHDNKWNFILTDKVWTLSNVKDVTDKLQTTWERFCASVPDVCK